MPLKCIFTLVLFVFTEKASPFIVLSMEDPLEGMQGALFRSLLDIDCLNSLQESVLPGDADNVKLLKDFEAPFLSMDDSIELIRRTGRDSHLLGLLGLEKINKDHDGLHCDQVQNPTALIQLEADSQERMDQELEEEEGEIETEVQPEEEREQEVKSPAAVSPATVCDLLKMLVITSSVNVNPYCYWNNELFMVCQR